MGYTAHCFSRKNGRKSESSLVCKAQARSGAELADLASLPSPATEMLLSDCREVGAPVIAASPCEKHRDRSPHKGGMHINAGKAFLSSWRSSIGRAWKFSIIEERPSVSHLINYYVLFLPCSPVRPENKELCLNNTASVKLQHM